MFVKTDFVKERGNSIGMFSRNGKATALLHSIFRDKKLKIKTKKDVEDDYLARMLNPHAEKKEEKHEAKSLNTTHESFFFRAVSREKAQPPKEKVPDFLSYKPKRSALEPKTAFFAIYTKPEHHRSRSVGGKENPPCLHGGITCDFKVRNLKKKFEKIQQEVNSSEIDIVQLANHRVIDEKTFELFKDPGITLISKFSGNNTNGDLSSIPNPQPLINLVMKYHKVKQELEHALQHNKEAMEHHEHAIPEKLRPKTPVPIPLHQQLPRPPLIRKTFYTENSQNTSFQTEGGSPSSTKKSFYNDNLRKTHHFDSYTKRKLPFPYEHMKCVFVDADNYRKVKPRTEPYIDIKKMVDRKGAFGDKVLTNSIADKADMNELFYKTFAAHTYAVDFSKQTGRFNHFMKKTYLTASPKNRDKLNNSVQLSYYTTNKSNDNSFITPFVC
jgi:hypothetical protein